MYVSPSEDTSLVGAAEVPTMPTASWSSGIVRNLAVASVGAAIAWCASSFQGHKVRADMDGLAQFAEHVKCKVPKDFCAGTETRKDTLSFRDCDGDGVLDPYCEGGELLRFGYVSSADGCKNTWPNGLCKKESQPKSISTPKRAAGNEITIIHFNDVYSIGGVLEGDQRSGGMSRAIYNVKKERERNPNRTFVVFAGDALSPSLLSDLFKGEQMIDILNDMKLDAASLGNHEFDFGVDMLNTRLSESNFPWLNVNLMNEKNELLGNTTKYFIRDVPWEPRWGFGDDKALKTVRVCFFGAAYDVRETMFKDKDRMKYKDIFKASEEAAEHLKKDKKCDVVMPLTHQFSKEDCELSKRLGDKVDLILGGHDHSTEFTSVCGHAPYVKAASDLKTQWVMTMWLDDDGTVHHTDGRIISLTEADPFDEAMHDKVVQWEEKAEKVMGKTMGCFGTGYDAHSSHLRQRETNAGDFFTDATRHFHKTDVVMINGGTICGHKTYEKGPVTRKILTSMHPYGNEVLKIWATGAELKEYIEHSLRCWEKVCGDFVQISGLRYEFNPDNKVGERLVKLKHLNDTEVTDDEKLTVGMSNYMWANSKLVNNKLFNMVTVNDKVPLLMGLYDYVEDAGDKCVTQELDGRIKNLSEK